MTTVTGAGGGIEKRNVTHSDVTPVVQTNATVTAAVDDGEVDGGIADADLKKLAQVVGDVGTKSTVPATAADRVLAMAKKQMRALQTIASGMEALATARHQGRFQLKDALPEAQRVSLNGMVGTSVAEKVTLLEKVLDQQPLLTAKEKKLILLGAKSVISGGPGLPATVTIRNNGFRPYQTQISLANVGSGHMEYTARSEELMRGLVVHHEHIDRPNKNVAAYRMIDIETNALLNYFVAGAAPVSVYYGVPNYDAFAVGDVTTPKPTLKGDGSDDDWKKFITWEHAEISKAYERDKETAARGVSGVASAAFSNGTTDVKVAMDGLTASQAIDLMQRVALSTDRDPRTQTYSAAFNLNRPILDDRPDTRAQNGGQPKLVDAPFAIAMLSVELAKAGGWEKVTADSASDKTPSVPLLELIQKDGTATGNPNALLDWVHAAHSAGLETYVSGGMKPEHFGELVRSGVGGVGVGTSMHHKEDLGNGKLIVKDMDPEKIKGAQKFRDEAEAGVVGQASRLLAQLDMLHAQEPHVPNPLRDRLFTAQRDRDTKALQVLVQQAIDAGVFTNRGAAYARAHESEAR